VNEVDEGGEVPTNTLTITLTLPVGISEVEAENVAYAALEKAKSYFAFSEADGFAAEWFDIGSSDD
jgi:hypothetical protein